MVDTTFQIFSPKLIHAKFNGVSNFELVRTKIKKAADTKSGISFICFKSPRNDHKEKIKKTKKKTNPKVLFELICLVRFFISIF